MSSCVQGNERPLHRQTTCALGGQMSDGRGDSGLVFCSVRPVLSDHMSPADKKISHILNQILIGHTFDINNMLCVGSEDW